MALYSSLEALQLTDYVDFALSHPWILFLTLFVGYWLLCRSLRWRRVNALKRKFKNRDLYTMSVEEAQAIINNIFHYESPYLGRLATSFALFRTYGIPPSPRSLTSTRLVISAFAE
jgi:hypothetical protein